MKSQEEVDRVYLNLCSFFSKFLRLHGDVDLDPIMVFLINQLEDNERYLYFILLKNILQEHIGFEFIHHLTKDQLKGCLGGAFLSSLISKNKNCFRTCSHSRKKLYLYLSNKEDQIQGVNFSYFWILYFRLCQIKIYVSYFNQEFSLKKNSELLDTLSDTQNLMTLLRVQYLEEEQAKEEATEQQANFILQNHIDLLPQDVL